jgi:hypothetical protein
VLRRLALHEGKDDRHDQRGLETFAQGDEEALCHV